MLILTSREDSFQLTDLGAERRSAEGVWEQMDSMERQRMNKEDMILISVDDHTVEPPGMFKDQLPTKYLDNAPRLVHNPDGSDMWKFRDTVIPNVALNPAPGRPKRGCGIDSTGPGEIRP